jgi:transcriptional regulator with XRE-family HTH domain
MNSPSEILLSFGSRLRQIRLERQLSQEDLADLAGFDRTYISLLERGKRNISLINISKLSKALQMEISELLLEIR